jgi:hypothetical protein
MYKYGLHLPAVLATLASIGLGTVTAINATGAGWEIAFKKAQAFTAKLTLEEKVSMVTGTGSRQNPRWA